MRSFSFRNVHKSFLPLATVNSSTSGTDLLEAVSIDLRAENDSTSHGNEKGDLQARPGVFRTVDPGDAHLGRRVRNTSRWLCRRREGGGIETELDLASSCRMKKGVERATYEVCHRSKNSLR